MSAQSANFVHFVTCKSRIPIRKKSIIERRCLYFLPNPFDFLNLSKNQPLSIFCAIFPKVAKKAIYSTYNKLQYSQMQDVTAE